MPKPNKQSNSDDGGIKIKVEKSSLTEFTKRLLPSEQEAERFEEFVEEEIDKRAGNGHLNNNYFDEEIDESLNEIYQDDNGGMVDVKKLVIKKRRGFLFWFFSFVFLAIVFAGAAYAAYNYFYLQPGSDATAVDFIIEGETEVVAGEEFFYTLQYRNSSNIVVRNVNIKATYPENFVFLDSSPEAVSNNSVWLPGHIPAHHSGKIKIKGMMIGAEDTTGIILAGLTYIPENFSSKFKKETSFTSVIHDIGLNIESDYITTALLGDENEVKLKIRGKENNFINNFRLTLESPENVELINTPYNKELSDMIPFAEIRPGVWQISEVSDEEKYLPIKFKFIEKTADSQEMALKFDYIYKQNDIGIATGTPEAAAGKYFTFYEDKLSFEVMKSDLNLTLIINGSRDDQGVDFGQTLNYSVVYKNKGETDMKDVVIMLVMESDFLDWASLDDGAGGEEKGNSLSWSKEEIPELEVLEINEEGTIDVAINVLELGEVDISKDYQVKSFVQYALGKTEEEEPRDDADNRSNIIVNRINSDLKLKEQIRYFNEDNIPVGTGPHPPHAGEITSYKVYWDLSNNLHELNDLKVTVKLPEYVGWDNKNRASVGSVEYKQDSHEVVWNIGRLPITVYKAGAEFSISITPDDEDKNTIMVILPGSFVEAIDIETEEIIGEITKAKTTKLEDDDIAGGDGIVE